MPFVFFSYNLGTTALLLGKSKISLRKQQKNQDGRLFIVFEKEYCLYI